MIDLRECKPGDLLIAHDGSKLFYVGPTPSNGFTSLDHVVKYLTDSEGREWYGTRTHEGYMWGDSRRDPWDIVKIITLESQAKIFETIPKNPQEKDT